MDIKVSGIKMDIMRKALEQAHVGRVWILGEVQSTLGTARDNVSTYAPRISHDPDTGQIARIRDVVGRRPRSIRSIIEAHRCEDRSIRGRWSGGSVGIGRRGAAQKAISIIQD